MFQSSWALYMVKKRTRWEEIREREREERGEV
jgi:hypothetical protein